jgi:predicted alpha-1,2-mannosidase
MDKHKMIFKQYSILPLVTIFSALVSCSGSISERNDQKLRPVDLVYPHIDAANSRWFFFSSASRPFGMVNLSPDMSVEGTWGTGYRYHVDTIRCFSHIHAWQLSGIPVLPVTGESKGHLGPDHYGSIYSHSNEVVHPGYHQVFLDSYGIKAELTSTTRVGLHRYTFPESDQSHILFDFTTTLGPSDTQYGYVKMNNKTELEGYAIMAPTRRRPKPVHVFFVAQFDKPFDKFSAWKDGQNMEIDDLIEGPSTGAYVTFATKKDEVRQMKVAISYVSTEQARLNLQTELPHWDFDKIVHESGEEWNRWLSRIEIEGGTETEQRRFYTDLWKALQGRRIISDANGKYCDMTGPERRIGQIPLDENGKPKFNHHNSDAFWGAQWSINTLWHLVYPEVTESFVNSMLLMYDDGGLIPRGPSGGNYTCVMTGASSTPFIVSAYMKGIRGFDIHKAFEGLRKNHMPGGMMSKAGYEHDSHIGGGIEHYIEKGYVPHPLSEIRYGFHQDGAAQTLEYAYQDWTLAQLAKTLGKNDDYELFSKRALNYKNIWHADSGWMWVKNNDGNWKEPFNVLDYGNGWVEGNAAQYTWWVPHDVAGLAVLMGGKEAMADKLNKSFEVAQKHDFVSGKSHSMETLKKYREVYINYGNQPCMQTAFLFNHIRTPWLTQYWTRQIVDKVYSGLSPDFGYSGDEDQGLMGTLAVLMKMGIFSVNGGTDTEPYYEIASPIFDKITLHLNPAYYSGQTFVIEVENNGPENFYIQSASFNDKDLNRPFINHTDVISGGKLKLNMGKTPNKNWGIAE